MISTSVFAKEISVKVNEMVCSLCAQEIQKKIIAVKEVKDLKVDRTNKVVSVTTNDNQDIKDSKIKEIITETGYNVSNIERK